MTEEQRDYLADLAGRKGVVLDCSDDRSAAWASQRIDELDSLPDVEFGELTEEERAEFNRLANNALEELRRWTFTQ